MNAVTQSKNREWFLIALILISSMIIFLLHVRRNGMVDDAFITYRYAARLSSGDGLTYNDNERILGTSTPSYALVLAFFAWLIGPDHIPTISIVINIIATIAFMLSVALIAFHISKNYIIAALSILSLMTSHYTTWVIVTGMETPLFLAILTGGWLLLILEWRTIAIVLFSLLPLFRPEGVFAAGMVALSIIVMWYHKRDHFSLRWLIGQLVLLGIPGLSYLIAATAYYGIAIPQSITSKSAGLYPYTISESAAFIAARLRGFVIPLFSPIIEIEGTHLEWIVLCLSLGIILAGSYWLIRRHRVLYMMPMMLIILLVFYAQSETLLFGWYFAQFDAFAVLCFVTGLYCLMSIGMSVIAPNIPRWLFVALSMLILIFIQRDNIFENAVFSNDTVRHPALDAREYDYYQLTQVLRDQLPAGTTIATPEVGVIGFYLPDVTIVDAAGLVSPQAVRYFPIPDDERLGPGVGAIPRSLIRDTQPDLVITFDYFAVNGIMIDDWFLSNYTLALQEANLTHEVGELLVYVRNDFDVELRFAY